MKTKIMGMVALLGFATGVAIAEVLDLSQIPVAVQLTINEYLGNGEVEQLLPRNYQGMLVYDVYIKRPGYNRELHITPAGKVLENDPNFLVSGAGLQMKRLSLADLPVVVQRAIRSELGTTPVDDIDERIFNGYTIYSVEFQRDGRNNEVQVTSDGTLFRPGNTYALGGIGAHTTSGTAAALSQRVTLNELPRDARVTAEREATGSPIEEIVQMTQNGRTFYEVTFKRDGRNVNLRIGPDGFFTDDNGLPLSSLAPQPSYVYADPLIVGGRQVTFAQLPLAAQNRIRRELNNAPIDSLREGVNGGRTVYDVIYNANGRRREMLLATDGTVLRSRDVTVVSPSAIVLSGARRVTFIELPSRVQNTVRTQVGGAPIDSIDEGLYNDRTTYLLRFDRDGQHSELVVGNDGSIIASPVLAVTSTGTPDSRLPLRYARTVTFNELPSAVQDTLRRETGSARLAGIQRGTIDGRPAYQASFTKNRQQTELRIAEDGSIISHLAAESAPIQP